MNWAAKYIEKLQAGQTVSFRPRGNSMIPRIKSGELCTVEPVTLDSISVGDVVLAKVNGSVYLHLVTGKRANQVQISNNKGHVNGWTKTVFGKLIKIEP
jgi:phage repressor protein C with HTH and peptisase S24 domain